MNNRIISSNFTSDKHILGIVSDRFGKGESLFAVYTPAFYRDILSYMKSVKKVYVSSYLKLLFYRIRHSTLGIFATYLNRNLEKSYVHKSQ